MEFFEVLKARHSVRIYVDRPVETEKLDRVLEAINRAPSAGNLQAFDVYVVVTRQPAQGVGRSGIRSELYGTSSCCIGLLF